MQAALVRVHRVRVAFEAAGTKVRLGVPARSRLLWELTRLLCEYEAGSRCPGIGDESMCTCVMVQCPDEGGAMDMMVGGRHRDKGVLWLAVAPDGQPLVSQHFSVSISTQILLVHSSGQIVLLE